MLHQFATFIGSHNSSGTSQQSVHSPQTAPPQGAAPGTQTAEVEQLRRELAEVKKHNALEAEKQKIREELEALKATNPQQKTEEDDEELRQLRAQLQAARAQGTKGTTQKPSKLEAAANSQDPADWDVDNLEVTKDVHDKWLSEHYGPEDTAEGVSMPMLLEQWLKTELDQWSLSDLRSAAGDRLGGDMKVNHKTRRLVLMKLLAEILKNPKEKKKKL